MRNYDSHLELSKISTKLIFDDNFDRYDTHAIVHNVF